MPDCIFVKNYIAPPIDKKEILRYVGCQGEADERTNALLDECLSLCDFAYRVCYRTMPVSALQKTLGQDVGKLALRRLCGAEYAVVFAATLGVEADRLLLRYAATSTAKAAMLQAIGAERIESLCNVFCKDLQTEWEERGYAVGVRFSAGYGDFPLQKQKEIFVLLDCERKIGLTLNESLLMSPTKSVTAIVPIGREKTEEKTGCATCGKTDCTARKNE